MHKQTHTVAGLALATAASLTVASSHPEHAVIMAASGAVGGVLPDLDIMIEQLKHRGISHTLWGLTAVATVVTLTGNLLDIPIWSTTTGLSLGYFAHLVTDSLTVTGIRWFDLTEFISKDSEIREHKKDLDNAPLIWYIYWKYLHDIKTSWVVKTQGSKAPFGFIRKMFSSKKQKITIAEVTQWNGDWDKKEALIFAALSLTTPLLIYALILIILNSVGGVQ